MIFLDIDDCQPDPCMHGGVCKDGINSFTCGCAHGFKGDICDISMFYDSIKVQTSFTEAYEFLKIVPIISRAAISFYENIEH